VAVLQRSAEAAQDPGEVVGRVTCGTSSWLGEQRVDIDPSSGDGSARYDHSCARGGDLVEIGANCSVVHGAGACVQQAP